MGAEGQKPFPAAGFGSAGLCACPPLAGVILGIQKVSDVSHLSSEVNRQPLLTLLFFETSKVKVSVHANLKDSVSRCSLMFNFILYKVRSTFFTVTFKTKDRIYPILSYIFHTFYSFVESLPHLKMHVHARSVTTIS